MSNWKEGEIKTQQENADIIKYKVAYSRKQRQLNNIEFVNKICKIEGLLYIKLKLEQYKVIKE